MIYVWIFFLIEILFYSIIKLSITDHELGLFVLIIFNVIVFMIFISKFKGKIRLLFFGAFTVRFILMLIDVFLRGYIKIPHSGSDTETFLNRAKLISGDLTTIIDSNYEFFIKFISIVFTITENERIILQYFNVLIGFTSVYIIYLIFTKLQVSYRNKTIGVAIVSFFPHSIIFSGILLRESLSAFFVLLSIYFLVKWSKENKQVSFIFSIIMILISALFHSGTIGFLVSHFFIIIFYSRVNNKLVFDTKSVLTFSFLLISLVSFFGFYDWTELSIFRKFNVDSLDDIYDVTTRRDGESAYLEGLSINNIFQFFIYSPIFMFYFLSSPIPINWRGFNDVFSFVLDGIFYLSISIFIMINFKKIPKKKRTLILIILAGVFASLFIFSTGVQNAGTALRHRHKLLYGFIVVFILLKEYREIEMRNSKEGSI